MNNLPDPSCLYRKGGPCFHDRNIKPVPTMLDNDIIDVQSTLKNRLRRLRSIKDTAKARTRKEFPAKADTGELLANLTLAIRHVEDAHTRLEWALEAYRGES